jgi:alanine dehydrogenase
MFIGAPKEIKADEYRVGPVPSTIKKLIARSHEVEVETLAGDGAGVSDDEYAGAGARVVATADPIFQRAELIMTVKEKHRSPYRTPNPRVIKRRRTGFTIDLDQRSRVPNVPFCSVKTSF